MPPTVLRSTALLLAVVVLNAVVSYRNTARVIDNSRWVSHTYQVMATLERVLSAAKEADLGQRLFTLTGDEKDLQTYTAAVRSVHAQVEHLPELTADNPEQQQRLSVLRNNIADQFAELDRIVQLRQDSGKGFEAGVLEEQLSRGKKRLDNLRALVEEMKASEEKLLQLRERDSASSAAFSLTGTIIGTCVTVALLLLASYLFHHDVKRKAQFAARLRQEQEWLQVTLLGIADAVIATDDQGLVKIMNPVAEQLTGWCQADAVGKPIEDVLCLVSETTHQSLANPVTRVLRERNVVKITNHTLLRARDGTERPIDDSAAPILAGSGKLAGVALIFRDVSARRQAEADLRRHAEELAGAQKRKDHFLALLGHELRNPLAPISNAVNIIAQVENNNPALEHARAMIERQVKHLTRLVDDLLDVSRIANNKIRLKCEPLDLVRLVRTAVEDHRSTLESAGLILEVILPIGPIQVIGDSIRLTQVVGNLLQNAIKFTDPGGRITVRLTLDRARRQVAVSIRDTGIGIDPALVPRLFESFSQADRALERNRGGLGLGLGLVKGIAELHGGRVQGFSAGRGQGSEFTLWLPFEEVSDKPLPDAGAEPASARRFRILIIEDNKDSADSMNLMLTIAGHEVAVAYNGTQGVAEARRFRPEVVLCDIGLPGMSGYEVARALRGDPALGASRLIAISGYGSAEDRRRALEAGFDLAMVKPVEPSALEQLLVP